MGKVCVLTIEGLNTALVGAYGSNTAITPTLDRLAASGLVLDQCFVDSLDRREQLLSLWTGSHAWQRSGAGSAASGEQLQPLEPQPPAPPERASLLWRRLDQSGKRGCFLTDDSAAAELAEEAGCLDATLISTPPSDRPVDAPEQSHVFGLFVAASELLSVEDEATPLDLVWVHSRGLRAPWDAPLQLRASFTDDDDPSPPAELGPPELRIEPDTDPDLIVGWGQVAAAQVAILDQAAGGLLEVLHARPDADQWSTAVISPGGVSIGEHRQLGWGVPQYYQERVQTIALLNPQPAPSIGRRCSELTQLPDLAVTIDRWLFAGSAGHDPSTSKEEPSLNATADRWPLAIWGRDVMRLTSDQPPRAWPAAHQLAVVCERGSLWVRSPAWSGKWEASPSVQVFVKPDDRWEICDVASRREDVVEQLLASASAFRAALYNGQREALVSLNDSLCELIR